MMMVTACGLGQPKRVGDDVVADMTVRPALLDDGYATAGITAILFDWVLGMAVIADSPGTGMTTTYLHLEMLRPALHDPPALRGIGRARHLRNNIAIGDGVITDVNGSELARATMGALLLGPPTNNASGERPMPPEEDTPSSGPGLAGARGDVVDASSSGAVLRFRPGLRLANVSGGVHGGVGVLMANRTLDAAVKAAGQTNHRLLELRAAFVRPIPATGDPIDCAAAVLHSGRRLTLVQGELRDQSGRPAVLVDATYMIGLTDDDDHP